MSFPALPPDPPPIIASAHQPSASSSCPVTVQPPQVKAGVSPPRHSAACPIPHQPARTLTQPPTSNSDFGPPPVLSSPLILPTASRQHLSLAELFAPHPSSPSAQAPASPGATPENSPAPPEPIPPAAEPPAPQEETGRPTTPQPDPEALEVISDRQDYDAVQQVLFAVGNVLLRFREAQLTADQVQVTEQNRQVLAEGNVVLTRGQQILRGSRLEYDLQGNQGRFYNVEGTISLPNADQDLSLDTPASNISGNTPLNPITVQEERSQPQATGQEIQTIRFQAARIEFTGDRWVATQIRITSDPFSPAELEVRADSATLERLSNTEDLVKLKRPRLVFDQGLSIPLLQNRIRLSRDRSDPLLIRVGIDDRDRGGFFVGSRFSPFDDRKFRLTFTPQIFLQRGIDNDFDFADPDQYGVLVSLYNQLTPTTSFEAFAALSTLDVTNLADRLRGRLRLNQDIGDRRLILETAYRERGANGSLGEQEVLSRTSLILESPILRLGKTGIDLDYRVLAEYITATSDRPGLDNPANAGRFQGSVSLQRRFTLWKGQGLPPTRDQGLRYTPQPIVPKLRLLPRVAGVFTGYTSGDVQSALIGSLRLEGEFGHFSRPYLDYTSFYLGYSQILRDGTSPFLFDRVVDEMVLSGGILQQIYGPFRFGVQTSLNVATGEFFNTDFLLDYSRRTYGLTLRVNPEFDSVSLLFRVGGFNWVGNRGPLSTPETGAYDAGIQETNDAF